jgi:hypothetical protein
MNIQSGGAAPEPKRKGGNQKANAPVKMKWRSKLSIEKKGFSHQEIEEVYQLRSSDQMRFPPRIFHSISKSLCSELFTHKKEWKI